MSTIGDIVVNLAANTSKFSKPMLGATKTLGRFASNAASSFAKITTAAAGAGAMFASIRGVKLAADAESMAVRMRTMLGDAGKARALLDDIQNFSAATPFQQMELNEAAAQLLAFGFAATDVMPTMRNLGDIAAGTQKPIADFVDIMGKVKAGGVAQMGDINRLADRGVPIFQALANTFGVAQSEVRKMVGQGKVDFAVLEKAMKSTTAAGGLFSGSMADQSKTILGKFSTLKDNLNIVFKGIGQAWLEAMDVGGALDESTKFAQQFQAEWMPAIRDAIKLLVGFAKAAKAAFSTIVRWADKAAAATEALRKRIVAGKTLLSEFDIFKRQDERFEEWKRLMAETGNTFALGVATGLEGAHAELAASAKLIKDIQDGVGHIDPPENNAAQWLFDALEAEEKLAAQFRADVTSFSANLVPALRQIGKTFADSMKSFEDKARSSLLGRAKMIRDEVKTDAERLKEQLADLQRMKSLGFLGDTQHARAVAQANERFGQVDRVDTGGGAGALERGSAEAFQAIQAAIRGGSGDPQKKTAKNTQEIVKSTQQAASTLQNIASGTGLNFLQLAVMPFN